VIAACEMERVRELRSKNLYFIRCNRDTVTGNKQRIHILFVVG